MRALVPLREEVLAWAAACDPNDRFGNHPRSFRVSWRDSVIDYREWSLPGDRVGAVGRHLDFHH